jgi:hypothetical protein
VRWTKTAPIQNMKDDFKFLLVVASFGFLSYFSSYGDFTFSSSKKNPKGHAMEVCSFHIYFHVIAVKSRETND